jgi:hypothetical protein
MHRFDASTRTIRRRAANVNARGATRGRCGTVPPVRWVRRGLVAVLLAAPVAVVAVVARPGSGERADTRSEGSGPDGALVAGDRVHGELGFNAVAEYRLSGDGSVLVGVAGTPPFDATLTVRAGDGDELAFNDDTNHLDPEVRVDLAAGDDVTVEVRELGGRGGSYTIFVE